MSLTANAWVMPRAALLGGILRLVSAGMERGTGPEQEMGLARQAVDGDVDAVRAVLQRVGPAILRCVRGVLGATDPSVEDVAQESLMSLLRALPAYRGQSSLSRYATRIAVRTALASRRRIASRREKLEAFGEDPVPPRPLEAPREATASARRRALIHALLEELPETQAETLVLRFILGHSLQEVADATGVPLNTVRSRIRLGKEALRKRIAGSPALAGLREVLS